MKIFKAEGNHKSSTLKSASKNSVKMGTLIGENTEIEGKIKCRDSLRIDGCVNGEINSEGLVVVGEKGIVKASIKAKNIRINGKVTGNITSMEKLELLATGEVVGDVYSQKGKLVIEEGARIHGKCLMVDSKAKRLEPDNKPTGLDNQITV